MKKILFILLLTPFVLTAQIRDVVVETYYIANATDAADTSYGKLEEGSRTYRVFVELEPGSRLKKIYGDAAHALKISSTENFYNNNDRAPLPYFGFNINKS